MNNNKWWADDDLPPPSMRHNYTHGNVRHFTPSSYTSPQFLSQTHQSEEVDKILEQRLTHLNMDKNEDQVGTLSSLEERAKMLEMNGENQNTPSVSEIEERFAKLSSLPVEDIRYPRYAFVNENEVKKETVEKLIRRARDDALLERDWDCVGKSEDKQDVDPEEFLKMRRRDVSVLDDMNDEMSISDMDMMGQDTIRNLKQIQRTMKLAKQRSREAANLTSANCDNRSMDKEIKKLMKLTNESNMRSEKITDELSRCWEMRLDHEKFSSKASSKSENSNDEIEIDYDELQKVLKEAEEAKNEAKQMVKESKKSGKKSGILSRIFSSR